ncbi:MAG TPA: hypothetical protein VLY24_29875 [Bryobacteraceae bacterium]|nr:hypothetical protein [Bryobacteraceae bacterium]
MNNLFAASPVAASSVLVVDRELGFMFALSQALRRRNIAAIPCCSVAEAEALMANLDTELGVLLINCSCPGVCAFARTLKRLRPELRVVGITSDARQCRQFDGLDATIRDPEDRRPEGIERCAELLRMFLRGGKQVYQ